LMTFMVEGMDKAEGGFAAFSDAVTGNGLHVLTSIDLLSALTRKALSIARAFNRWQRTYGWRL
jgi:microcystin degradation protein MlrC